MLETLDYTIRIASTLTIFYIYIYIIYPKREETLRDDYETQLTASVDANVRSGDNHQDDGYVITAEATSEIS